MSASMTRDYRIDFFRGLALVMIFINHIPGNVVGNYTNRNFGFSDAAEAFVLLAGFAAASAYYRRFAGGQPIATSVRVVRRAGLLYTAHILSTVLALALFSAASIWLSAPHLRAEIHIWPVLQDPARGLIGIVTLLHQLGYFNILPLYIVMLTLLPAGMLLYRYDWRLLFVLSLVLYLAAGFWRLTLPSFPAKDAWFLNPLSWQFLFIIGFIWSTRWRDGKAVPYSRYLFWPALAYLIVAFVATWWQLWQQLPKFEALGALGVISKTYISPPRLLHVLALAYVIAYTPLGQWMKKIPATNIVTQMGQHALPIYCVGTLLSMAFMIARDNLGGSLVLDLASVTLGVSIMIVLASFLAWQSRTPAGQIGSAAAGGFMAAPPPVPAPPIK